MHNSVPHLSERLHPFILEGYDSITIEVTPGEHSTEIRVDCRALGKSCPVDVPEDVVLEIVNLCDGLLCQFERIGGAISSIGLGVSRDGKCVAWAIAEDG
jgi:hypothetical protein